LNNQCPKCTYGLSCQLLAPNQIIIVYTAKCMYCGKTGCYRVNLSKALREELGESSLRLKNGLPTLVLVGTRARGKVPCAQELPIGADLMCTKCFNNGGGDRR
jgi:hypothetical protein